MQVKKSVQHKSYDVRANLSQDNKYIYNDEPVDWPTNNRSKAGENVCVCPNCGSTTDHKYGLSCFATKCLKCGAQMRTR